MSKSLAVVEQREVTFYDDELTAVRAEDGRVYASLRHMCEALQIDTTGQRQRIQRHTVLARGLMVCKIQTIQGERDAYVLRVDLVPLWLTGVRTSMVKDDVRAKLEHFQEEAAAVLWEAFQDGRLTADPAFDELLQQDSPAAQAYKMAAAIMKMARHQLLLESRINTHDQQLSDHDQRLEAIETQLGSGRTITPDQATAVSQAVKAIARELGKQTKRNEYGAVYGELYRRYRIPSYRELPAGKYEDAMQWLGEWYQDLTGEEAF